MTLAGLTPTSAIGHRVADLPHRHRCPPLRAPRTTQHFSRYIIRVMHPASRSALTVRDARILIVIDRLLAAGDPIRSRPFDDPPTASGVTVGGLLTAVVQTYRDAAGPAAAADPSPAAHIVARLTRRTKHHARPCSAHRCMDGASPNCTPIRMWPATAGGQAGGEAGHPRSVRIHPLARAEAHRSAIRPGRPARPILRALQLFAACTTITTQPRRRR